MLVETKTVLAEEAVLKTGYYITENEIELNGCETAIYGIEIDTENQTTGTVEHAVHQNLSYDRDDVIKLIKMLAENDVTSVSLSYILDDMA